MSLIYIYLIFYVVICFPLIVVPLIQKASGRKKAISLYNERYTADLRPVGAKSHMTYGSLIAAKSEIKSIFIGAMINALASYVLVYFIVSKNNSDPDFLNTFKIILILASISTVGMMLFIIKIRTVYFYADYIVKLKKVIKLDDIAYIQYSDIGRCLIVVSDSKDAFDFFYAKEIIGLANAKGIELRDFPHNI